jgi:hypothetical protein
VTLLVLAYLGGVLTIASPCILPVLPFVFARADRPFVKTGLPILVGMAVTFAAVATLAAVAGAWVVDANEYGRTIAMVLLAVFGLTLIFPGLANRATKPFVDFGATLSSSAERDEADRGDGAAIVCARDRDRLPVGAMRGTGARPDFDGRRAQRRQCRHDTVAARLCLLEPQRRWRLLSR